MKGSQAATPPWSSNKRRPSLSTTRGHSKTGDSLSPDSTNFRGRYTQFMSDESPDMAAEVEVAAPVVQRYKLTIAYDGTLFHGWQKQEPPGQESLRTVAGSGSVPFSRLAAASLKETSVTFSENVENAFSRVETSG